MVRHCAFVLIGHFACFSAVTPTQKSLGGFECYGSGELVFGGLAWNLGTGRVVQTTAYIDLCGGLLILVFFFMVQVSNDDKWDSVEYA